MSGTPKRLAKGLWRWTARHPEWHPDGFGAEVGCFAIDAKGETLLVDPLLPEDPEPAFDLIEKILGDRLTMLITIPLHVRSSEQIWRRYRKRADTTIRGHPACAKRLSDRSGFREFDPIASSSRGHRPPDRQAAPLRDPAPHSLSQGAGLR